MQKNISYRLIKLSMFTVTLLFAWALKLTAQSNDRKVPVLELKGNAWERGLQHGTQLKGEIAAVFTRWKKNMSRSGDNPDTLIKAFLAATNFEPITKKYIPAILEEIKGIAEGSGQSYDDVFAFQLLDEFWIYLDTKHNEDRHHCSGMGVPATAEHPAYIAQNMDVENYMQGGQVLLHLPANGKEPEQYIITCAGLVALNGMNAAGIGLCMNTVMELQASTDGLPVAFIIRAVLNQKNGKDAMNFLQKVKHASGQNYILGIADSVYDFEASANQVVRFLPGGEKSTVVYHTNHALANHDVKPWHKEAFEKRLAGIDKTDNSVVRLASLEKRIGLQPAAISTDIIKSTLRSKDNPYNPVCRTYREGGFGFTFSSILFTLSSRRSVQLTYGSPDQSEFAEYYFTATK
jgi:isopenicillin-N N-acyltransferase like protein